MLGDDREIRSGHAVRARYTIKAQHARLDAHTVVERAKVSLSQRYGLSLDQAFEMLQAYSRRHNVKIADVARVLVRDEL